jgi:hypothetical protein
LISADQWTAGSQNPSLVSINPIILNQSARTDTVSKISIIAKDKMDPRNISVDYVANRIGSIANVNAIRIIVRRQVVVDLNLASVSARWNAVSSR